MDNILENIREYAEKAHGDQKRKYTSDLYIVHPIRVMLICKAYTEDLNVLAAALLHDVLEDTKVDKEEMKVFLMQEMEPGNAITTLNYVIELTDVYTKASFPQFNRKKRKEKEAERLGKTSAQAQTIKYADILDNSQETVGHGKDEGFAPVYLSECMDLIRKMEKGNETLRKRARITVEKSIKKIG